MLRIDSDRILASLCSVWKGMRCPWDCGENMDVFAAVIEDDWSLSHPEAELQLSNAVTRILPQCSRKEIGGTHRKVIAGSGHNMVSNQLMVRRIDRVACAVNEEGCCHRCLQDLELSIWEHQRTPPVKAKIQVGQVWKRQYGLWLSVSSLKNRSFIVFFFVPNSAQKSLAMQRCFM